LEAKPEAEAFDFESSISVDSRLALDDVRGSRAHAAMLGARGIIPAEAAAKLDEALSALASELESGTLAIDADVEDVHSFIEGVLTARLGDLGRMVHAGRSRNDQVALDARLYLKRFVPELVSEVRSLRGASGPRRGHAEA
jgi:argininosuccinate lyase